MVWAIKLENSGYLNFDTQTSYHQDLSVYRFEADFVIPSGTTTPIYFVARNTSFSGYISIQSNGELRVRYNGTNLSWPSFGYPDDDQLHTIVVVRNGASHEAFLDGSSKGTVSNSITSPFLLTGIGNAGTLTSNFYLSRMRLWNNATGTGTPIHDHDANSSDRSNTGQQPILTDTAGGNNATGVGLPTDGSAWIDLGGGGLSIIGQESTFTYQSVNASVQLTGQIDITGQVSTYVYNSIDGSVSLTGNIEISGLTSTYQYQSVDGNVNLTGDLLIQGQTSNYNYQSVNAFVVLTGSVEVIGSVSNVNYQAVNATVEIGSQLNIIGQTSTFDYQSIDATVTLQGDIDIVGQTSNYNFQSVNATIRLSSGRQINVSNVMVSYADDGIQTSYADDSIQINYADDGINIFYG